MRATTKMGGCGEVFRTIRISPRVSVRLWGSEARDMEEAWYVYVDGKQGTLGPFLDDALGEAVSYATHLVPK